MFRPSSVFLSEKKEITALAVKCRIPVIYDMAAEVEAEGLISYRALDRLGSARRNLR
jgi:hypothetical protein